LNWKQTGGAVASGSWWWGSSNLAKELSMKI